MTRDDVVRLTQRRLGYRTDLAADIVSELDVAQQELEKMLPTPWFLQFNELWTFAKDFSRMSLPENFIGFTYNNFSITYPQAPQFRLRSIPYDEMKNELLPRNAPKGRPKYYAMKERQALWVWPMCDITYNVEACCFIGEDPPSTVPGSSWNTWMLYEPELLALSAAIRIAPSLRDSELTAFLSGEITRLTTVLKQYTMERQENGIDRIINENLLPDNEEEAWR